MQNRIIQPRLYKRRAEDRLDFQDMELLQELTLELHNHEPERLDMTRIQINLLNKEYNNGTNYTPNNWEN